MARFGRLVTAMVTPFRSDGSLNLDEARRLASWLVEQGSEAILVAGSTGESPVLTYAEKVDLFKAVREAIGSHILICGTGTYSTAETVELTAEAAKAGADAVLVVTPYYNRPPQRALVEHFRTVAEASDVPVMLYDIPSRTATKLANDTILQCASHPNIVALKEASGDLSELARLFAVLPEGFEVYSGNDDWTLPLQALGAVGVVSTVSNVASSIVASQVASFERGDLEHARAVAARLVPLIEAAFCTTNPIPVKAMVRRIGFDVGRPRLPLADVTETEQALIDGALQKVGLI